MDALVSWNASPETNVIEYHIYHGYAPLEYFGAVGIVAVPGTQYQFTGLDDFKTHYFAVTAFNNASLESAFSVEVSKRVAHRLTMK